DDESRDGPRARDRAWDDQAAQSESLTGQSRALAKDFGGRSVIDEVARESLRGHPGQPSRDDRQADVDAAPFHGLNVKRRSDRGSAGRRRWLRRVLAPVGPWGTAGTDTPPTPRPPGPRRRSRSSTGGPR